jgi:hypothetical protein
MTLWATQELVISRCEIMVIPSTLFDRESLGVKPRVWSFFTPQKPSEWKGGRFSTLRPRSSTENMRGKHA